mgnify:CR=1 FL=1
MDIDSSDIGYYSNNVIEDSRFIKAFELFNSCEWYKAHDLFEDVWHETFGPFRQILQALIQISVAQLHLENNNRNGALILYGEALGRLKKTDPSLLDLDFDLLCFCLESRLNCLQNGTDPEIYPLPFLSLKN